MVESGPGSGSPASRVSGAAGYSALIGYLVWNAYWLILGRIPPSMLKELFHLPAPTTGFLRSLRALLRGDVLDSILWNPFAVPLAFLFLISLLILVGKSFWGRRVVLPRSVGAAWLFVLPLAWIAKFALGPAWW